MDGVVPDRLVAELAEFMNDEPSPEETFVIRGNAGADMVEALSEALPKLFRDGESDVPERLPAVTCGALLRELRTARRGPSESVWAESSEGNANTTTEASKILAISSSSHSSHECGPRRIARGGSIGNGVEEGQGGKEGASGRSL